MKTFEELGVSEEIRRAIEELGFENPMPVQEEVIPYLLGNKNDVIALAQTGTGKTASYGIPVIQKTDASSKQTQAIILSPTRELCLQIADDLNSFAKYIDGLHIAAVYGGTDIGSQIRTLKHGVQIIVATPGRLLDLINRGVAQLENVNNVVLDEADEMLNMGFSESINAIFENVPEDRNTLLFSATMSKDIEKIALNYLHDHKEIVVGSRNEGAEHVNHIYYLVNAKDKYLALKRVVDFYPRIFAIIFCRTKLETQDIADKLIKDGYNAEALHGDLSQQQRDLTMQKFRNHTYAKTRPVYDAYRKSGYSSKFLEAHREEVTLHKTAKAAFNESGLKKLPKVKDLNAEYSALLTKKKALYPEYRKTRDEMQEIVKAQKNVELFFAEEKDSKQVEQIR